MAGEGGGGVGPGEGGGGQATAATNRSCYKCAINNLQVPRA